MSISFAIILLLVIALVLFIILLKNKKLKGNVIISLIYMVLTSVVIAAGGFLYINGFLNISFHFTFVILCFWILLAGIGNVSLMYKILPWAKEEEYWTKLLFTIINGLFGSVLLLIIFKYLNYSFYPIVHLTAVLLFIFPFLFYGTLLKYLRIPVKILRKWHYPVDQHIEDPQDREMESPLVVAFEFKKKSNDKVTTTFRAKAPKEMIFGKLFYYFINDYNDRNPEEKIEYLDEKNKPENWIFYLKPNWFGSIRYIDPEETNSFNFIRENSIIICKRITKY